MRRIVWRAVEALAILTAVVALAACPPLIQPSVLLFAEDNRDPVISLDSPTNRSAFDSSVLFTGTVTDSAATEGDLQGKVVSLAYAVVDHQSLDGTATIGEDGSFSFTIDTRELTGDQTVILTALDWNGNIGKVTIEILDPGVGPDIVVVSPAANSIYLSTVTVTGIVNNRDESVAVTEVDSLRYEVLGSSIDGEVEFSTSDGSFSFDVSTVGLTGRIVIQLTATDKNGRTSEVEIELLDRSDGPALTVSSPEQYSKYQASVTVTGNVTNKDNSASTSEVKSFSYQILGKTSPKDVDFVAGTGRYSFTFSTVGMDGNIIIQLTARDKNNRSTVLDYTLLEDTAGPYIIIDPPLDSTNYGVTIALAGRVRNSESDTTHFDDVSTSSVSYVLMTDAAVPITLGSTGAFSLSVSTIGRSGTLIIKVSAADLNGHITQQSITMLDNMPGPTVTITDAPQYYSSTATTSITVEGTVSSPDTLLNDRMAYTVTHSGGSFSAYIPDEQIDAGGVFWFTFAIAQTPRVTGTATIVITANDSGGREKQQTSSVYDDTIVPYIVSGQNMTNDYIVVNFPEQVFSTASGSGALEVGDFTTAVTTHGGTTTAVTMDSLTKTDGVTALEGGETSIWAWITPNLTPSGVETVAILPANGTSVYDHVGNPMSSAATTGSLPLGDEKAPDAPSEPDLATADDTGTSGTDSVTKQTTGLTFSGTAEAGATVNLYRAGSVYLGSDIADATGAWSIDGMALAPGTTHSITAEATDTVGLIGPASTPLEVEVDTTPPGAPSSAPDLATADDSGDSSTDEITNDTSLTFSVDATEEGTVKLYRAASTLLGSVAATGAGAFNVTGVTLGEGAGQQITATLTDIAGNESGESAALEVTVDRTAPAAPGQPDLATADDSGDSSTDNITNDASAAFSANVTEAGTVEFFSGGTVSLGTVTATGSGSFGISGVNLAAGGPTVTATLTDAAGNESTASTGLLVTVDRTAPAPPSAAPDLATTSDTGDLSTDNRTKLTEGLSFRVTVATAGTIKLYSDASGYRGSASSTGSGTYSVSADLAEGSHPMYATLSDTAGNESASSASLAVVVDATVVAPNAPDLDSADDAGPSATDNYTNIDTDMAFSVTVTEAGTINLYRAGTVLLGSVTATAAGPFSVTGVSLPTGSSTITAKLTDTAGNISSASSGLTVTVDKTPPSAPTGLNLADASDSGRPGVTADTTDDTTNLTSGLVFDGSGAEAEGRVYLTSGVDGALGYVDTTTAGTWEMTAVSLSGDTGANVTHSITATVMDQAGNTSGASTALTVVIDIYAPANAPASLDLDDLDDTGTAGDDITSQTTDLTFSGTGGMVSGRIVLYSYVSGGDTVEEGYIDTTSSGTWTIDLVTLDAGALDILYQMTAKKVDPAGNLGPASTALEVTITPP